MLLSPVVRVVVVLALPKARKQVAPVHLVKVTTAAAVFITPLAAAGAVLVLLDLTQPRTLAAQEAQDSPTRLQDQA